jgi:hypothetical protein
MLPYTPILVAWNQILMLKRERIDSRVLAVELREFLLVNVEDVDVMVEW